MFDTLEITGEAAPYPISRLRREDAGRVAAFVTGLDQDTLQLRFGRFMSAAAIHAHYAGVDWDGAVLLAWQTGPENDLQIGGVVEVHPYPAAAPARPGSIHAEIALVFAQGSRERGIGRALLSSGIAAAARCGAVRSTMLISARDHALARMALRLGFTVDAAGDRAVFAHPGDRGGPLSGPGRDPSGPPGHAVPDPRIDTEEARRQWGRAAWLWCLDRLRALRRRRSGTKPVPVLKDRPATPPQES